MEQLIENMKKVLASTVALYLKASNYHWNVQGPNFHQFHSFFGEIYEQNQSEIDPIAEQIRTLQAYAPASFERYSQLSVIKDELSIPSAMAMVSKLEADNLALITLLKQTQKMAEEQNAVGLANFLQDLVDKHYKTDWQLKATLKV
jgi:starvation-inducible DNA-binding protein